MSGEQLDQVGLALARADFAKAIEIEWRLWGAIKGLYPNYLDEIEAERQAKPQ